jgi:Protein of unknown function (DUF1579)
MKRTAVALVVLLFAVAAQAQDTKPAPELRTLEPWIGDWTINVQAKDGPSEPEYNLAWTIQCRWILEGFFMEATHTRNSKTGEWRAVEIFRYDPIKKQYESRGFGSNGGTWAATATFRDGTFAISRSADAEGKPPVKWRNTFAFSADRMSFSLKGEQEKDGTWWTSSTGKGVKTKAASKGQ